MTDETASGHEAPLVLVVEDNPDNMFVLTDLLESPVALGGCGLRCEARTRGSEIFGYLAAHPRQRVDLILLDIQIPLEDGYEILRQIRERPLLRQTTVVAVTANVMQQDVDRARQAGFDGFIGKPIVASRFPDQIRRIMAGEQVWEPR